MAEVLGAAGEAAKRPRGARLDQEATPAAGQTDQLKLPADELAHAVKGAGFPATKQGLLEKARDNGAPRVVLEALERLPGDHFDSPAKVAMAYEDLRHGA